MSKKITKKAFRNWLESKNPDDFAGFAAQSNSCPIANFYADVFNYNIFYVEDGEIHHFVRVGKYYWNEVEYSHKLPEWAKKFIIRLDDSFDWCEGVTAEGALNILENV